MTDILIVETLWEGLLNCIPVMVEGNIITLEYGFVINNKFNFEKQVLKNSFRACFFVYETK